MKQKRSCVRCEILGRKQKSKEVHYILNELGESVPICSACLLEIKEEDETFKQIEEEDYDRSSEDYFE